MIMTRAETPHRAAVCGADLLMVRDRDGVRVRERVWARVRVRITVRVRVRVRVRFSVSVRVGARVRVSVRVRCAAPTCRACAATCAPPPPAAQGEGEASSDTRLGIGLGSGSGLGLGFHRHPRLQLAERALFYLVLLEHAACPAALACARAGARGISHAVDEREVRASPRPTPTHAESARATPLCTGRSPPGRPVTKEGMQAGRRAEPGRP